MANTPRHAIRIPDELWAAAQEEAVRRGESVAVAINRFLAEYTGVTAPTGASAQTVAAIARRQAS